MATANLFFSLLALATNVATVAFVVLLVRSRSDGAADLLRRGRAAALPLAAAIAIVSMLGSLYYSEVVGLRPCTLCWYQRGAMYPLAVVLAAAVLLRRNNVWRIGVPLSVVGLMISGYHYLIQHAPSLSIQSACSADVPCTAAEMWEFGFISLAYMAGSAFLLITLLLAYGVRQRNRPDVRTTAAGRRDAGVALTGTLAAAGVCAVLFTPAAAPEPSGTSPTEAAVGSPQVDGGLLPVLESADSDSAVGLPMPGITGTNYAGEAVTIAADDRPKIIMVVAHWCPHCQAEVPAVQGWLDANGQPEAVDLYSISTAAAAGQANYPPLEWLNSEGWSVPVIADDDAGTARTAVGVSGYPFFVFVGADGNVVGRHAGELGIDELARIIEELPGAVSRQFPTG